MSNNPNQNSGEKPSSNGKFLDQETWEALKAAGYTDEQLYADQPFGPIIFSYTRKQAIDDGVLVDLTQPGFARIFAKCGIRVHTAMTAECFAQTVCPDLNATCAELTGQTLWNALCRLAAVLTAFGHAVRKLQGDTDRVDFHVEGVEGQDVAMYGHMGPGDEGEPVLTLMLEGED